MNKRTARITLILILAAIAALVYTAFVGWGPTGTGAAKNIKLGLDLEGGVSITYQAVDENPSAEDMSDTVYKLQQRVDGYSTEASVYQEGSNRINIEIPGVSNADEILAELGKPGSLQFQLDDGTVILDGTHVVAAEAASILRGKKKPIFTPHVDTGDYVIVINAEKVEVTGKKRKEKIYKRHTGYPGGLREITFEKLLDKAPEEIIRHAVKGMMPGGRLGRQMFKKLKVYAGPEHKHAAQKPEIWEF